MGVFKVPSVDPYGRCYGCRKKVSPEGYCKCLPKKKVEKLRRVKRRKK